MHQFNPFILVCFLSCVVIGVIAFILLKNKDNAKFIVGGIVLFYLLVRYITYTATTGTFINLKSLPGKML